MKKAPRMAQARSVFVLDDGCRGIGLLIDLLELLQHHRSRILLATFNCKGICDLLPLFALNLAFNLLLCFKKSGNLNPNISFLVSLPNNQKKQ